MTNDSTPLPPRCAFVTGPRVPGQPRWLETRIAWLREQQPEARCAVLLADERLTGTARFADPDPGVDVRCVFMPCLCCPGSADLPRIVRTFAATTHADWLFVEVPVLAAAGLIAEFDHVVRWPRDVVVSLNPEWARARLAQRLSVFQTRILALADHIVEATAAAREATPASPVPSLNLT